MAQRVHDALDALRALQYTPFELMRDLLRSEDAEYSLAREELRAQRHSIIGLLPCNPATPNAHAALDALDAAQYKPHQLIVDILRSNDARCSAARRDLAENSSLLLNLLLRDARTPFDRTVAFLDIQRVPPTTFITQLLECSRPVVAKAVSTAVQCFLPLLVRSNESAVTTWCLQYARQFYTAEMLRITHKNAGFHANASKAQPEQIESFNLSELATKLRQMAPKTWDLFSCLTDARGSVRRARPTSGSALSRDDWIVGTQDVGGHFDLIAIADDQVEADVSDDEEENSASLDERGAPNQPPGPADDPMQVD